MARKLNHAEARQYAIGSIRDFLEGAGGKWDWDDFISIPTGFPDLEAVQNLCAHMSATHPHPVDYCNEEGFNLMRQKLEELERDASPQKPATQI
jgi:hypothetical protein